MRQRKRTVQLMLAVAFVSWIAWGMSAAKADGAQECTQMVLEYCYDP